jgi:chromosome segregation ATPase
MQNSVSLRHFARHLFIVSNAYAGRKKSREDVDVHLHNMRKAIIRMSLSYNDIDRLKQKIENLVDWERRYAKLFKLSDKETDELKRQISMLEDELGNEREEKSKIISENDERVNQLTASLSNIKNQMRHLHLEKAKRQHRLNALESKIREKVDVRRYYSS